ncbi:hypothetical protein ETD86_24335 [Nonomuraea turkmeniaca]|uniref:Uncharacterized protein n=1 Tax=Nonomuraea turkmeniaca TaxID=103838 RepID=A0A5S4FED5_9ACTN|nr:hypothetical protein [Nonomuraea turkmeniaca]TMR16703.1 hypothetical protein ETD86_24335 [Nonomuraea turkmeniaca]
MAVDGVMPFELSMPSRIFRVARGPGGEPLYEVVTCTIDGRPVATEADPSAAARRSGRPCAPHAYRRTFRTAQDTFE